MPTSLKVPLQLKERIDALAQRRAQSTHSFMLDALARQVEIEEAHEAFIRGALQAEKEMDRTGEAYAAADVHAYLDQLVRSVKAKRPKPIAWRRSSTRRAR